MSGEPRLKSASRGAAVVLPLLLLFFGPAIAAIRDVEYPGALALSVDVSDVGHRVFHVAESIPVDSGTVTLRYPKWLPGNHAPRGPIEQLGGLTFSAAGRRLAWQRDPLDAYAFRVKVPAGASRLDVAFDVATPQTAEQGRIVVTPGLLGLQWNQVLLYPAGYYVRHIPVIAEVRLPAGWVHASALPVNGLSGDRVRFAPVPLEELVDSPVFAGQFAGRLDLTPPGGAPVRLNLFAEMKSDLVVTDAQLAAYRALVREAIAALGPPRYDRYDFLLALSETFGGIGLEHLRSSENSHAPTHFRSWDEDVGSRDKLAHEFTHSWNGKYRRPARLWTPDYDVPMNDDLLWVYEGLTEYYGFVLAARAGLWSEAFARDVIAAEAGLYDRKRPGRAWRPLQDTTAQPVVTPRRPLSWPSWQRGEDYYAEGALLWLEIDQRLRELSGGARSLDDFARAFFAARANQGAVSTYGFDDVVAALRAIAPFDWARLLRERLDAVDAPLDEGLRRAGWRLVYDERPNETLRDAEKARRTTDLSYSLGVTVGRDAALTEVVWGSPAYAAGLTLGTTLIAVQGRAYTADLLKDAMREAQRGGEPIELLVRNQDRYRTVRVDYREGLRQPRLERIANAPDRLADVLRARSPTPP